MATNWEMRAMRLRRESLALSAKLREEAARNEREAFQGIDPSNGWEIRTDNPEYMDAPCGDPCGYGATSVTNEPYGFHPFGGGRVKVNLHKSPYGDEWFLTVGGWDINDVLYRRGLRDRDHALAVMRRIPVVVSRQTLHEMGFRYE